MKKFNVKVNGNSYQVEVEEIGATAAPTASAPAAPVVTGDATAVVCPMPGTIVDVKVKTGDAVKQGDVLVVFEAMKMENEIMAAADGVVADVLARKGDSVESGQVLLTVK